MPGISGSNPTVCAKDSTLRGAVFYFCGELCKGCKGAGESHRLRQVSLLDFTLGSDFLLPLCKISMLFL